MQAGNGSQERLSTGFTEFAAELRRRLGVDEVVALTTMPRGGLQVCQTVGVHESGVRRYLTSQHERDCLSWRALSTGFAAPETTDEESAIASGMIPVVAVRIESLVFTGYPGVIQLLVRKDSMTTLNGSEAVDLVRTLAAGHLRSASAEEAQVRQFVFDSNGKCVFPPEGFARMDRLLASQISEIVARSRSEKDLDGRICLTDSRGIMMPAAIAVYESYPAICPGRVIFVSLHPEASDWHAIAGSTFNADPELSRLIAAVTHMIANYRSGPTLDDIAASVQLSQFHFHRRFTEMVGLTPKHLLFDLQVDEAKRLLGDQNKSLVEIARHCGFAHQSHFTSRFKQGTGVTPTRWRRHAVMGQTR